MPFYCLFQSLHRVVILTFIISDWPSWCTEGIVCEQMVNFGFNKFDNHVLYCSRLIKKSPLCDAFYTISAAFYIRFSVLYLLSNQELTIIYNLVKVYELIECIV